MSRLKNLAISGLAAAVAVQPNSLWACAACYGASDSPLAHGMNLGIVALLGTVGVVFGGFTAFFVFLAKKSASTAAASAPTGSPDSPAGPDPSPLTPS